MAMPRQTAQGNEVGGRENKASSREWEWDGCEATKAEQRQKLGYNPGGIVLIPKDGQGI